MPRHCCLSPSTSQLLQAVEEHLQNCDPLQESCCLLTSCQHYQLRLLEELSDYIHILIKSDIPRELPKDEATFQGKTERHGCKQTTQLDALSSQNKLEKSLGESQLEHLSLSSSQGPGTALCLLTQTNPQFIIVLQLFAEILLFPSPFISVTPKKSARNSMFVMAAILETLK